MGAGALDAIRSIYTGFAQRLGEVSADALLDWVRERTRERRRDRGIEWADGPPDFFSDRDAQGLSHGLTGELADVLGIPEDRLELLTAERRDSLALWAAYRDTETGHAYTVELARDSATFTRVRDVDPPA